MTEASRYEMRVEGAVVALGDRNPLTGIEGTIVSLARTRDPRITLLVVRLPRDPQRVRDTVVHEIKDDVVVPPREPQPDDDYVVQTLKFEGNFAVILDATPEKPVYLPTSGDPTERYPAASFQVRPELGGVFVMTRTLSNAPLNVLLPRTEIVRFLETGEPVPGLATEDFTDPALHLWQVVAGITGLPVTADSNDFELAMALSTLGEAGQDPGMDMLNIQLSSPEGGLSDPERTALAMLINNHVGSFSELRFAGIRQQAREITGQTGS